ncbi:MAG: lytic transglycosylase domain-containing protein [Chloroflexota bacterium]
MLGQEVSKGLDAIYLLEVTIILGLFIFLGGLPLFAFVSLAKQTVDNQALLQQAISLQTSQLELLDGITSAPPSFVLPTLAAGQNQSIPPKSPKDVAIAAEYLPEIAAQMHGVENGVYISSLFLFDAQIQIKSIVPFEISSTDHQHFFLQGNHLIARPTAADLPPSTTSIQLQTVFNDGSTQAFLVNVSIRKAASFTEPNALQVAPVDNEPIRAISAVFTPEVQHWETKIIAWGESHNLDPNIIATIMQIESCGNPEARSVAGAQGLFQVMPHHFAIDENMFAPDLNAERSLMYYKQGLEFFDGDMDQAFAGYNAGHGFVRSTAEADWPNETQQYLYWAQGIYDEAKSGAAVSQRLEEWLAFGGASLCQDAAAKLGI